MSEYYRSDAWQRVFELYNPFESFSPRFTCTWMQLKEKASWRLNERYCCCCCCRRALSVYCLNTASVLAPSQRLSSSGWWCWRVCIHPARAWGSSRPTQAQFWTGRGWELEHCLWLRRECVHVPRVSYCRRHLCTHLVIYLCIDSINKHIVASKGSRLLKKSTEVT